MPKLKGTTICRLANFLKPLPAPTTIFEFFWLPAPPRPYFRIFLDARPFPAPIFDLYRGPAPPSPLFTIFLPHNPAARPGGAGSGQREQGRSLVDDIWGRV